MFRARFPGFLFFYIRPTLLGLTGLLCPRFVSPPDSDRLPLPSHCLHPGTFCTHLPNPPKEANYRQKLICCQGELKVSHFTLFPMIYQADQITQACRPHDSPHTFHYSMSPETLLLLLKERWCCNLAMSLLCIHGLFQSKSPFFQKNLY